MTHHTDVEVAGAWIARFRDGPAMHEPEHVFMVGPIWHRIELAPMPATEMRPLHWQIVGGDGILGDDVAESTTLWPGQIGYQLIEVDDSGDEPVAYYGVDQTPPRPMPPYLWPQRGPFSVDDLRMVPTTRELRAIVKLLDRDHLAGFTMLAQRDGSPWLEVDVVVPFHVGGRDWVRQEIDGLAPHEALAGLAHGGLYRFVIWRYTGEVYRVGRDGAVEDDPINLDDD